jgi:hypothetical protein
MATQYIPTKDSDFKTWIDNNSAMITANYSGLGISSADAAAYASLVATFDAAYAAATSGDTRGPMTVTAKDTARANAEARARQLATIIQANPSVTNETKTALGYTIRKIGKTPVPAPTTYPILSFANILPLQHVLRYSDSGGAAPRARPFGVTGLMLSWWITPAGTAPTGPANFIQPFTRIPIGIAFDSSSVGKLATYSAKWTNAKAELGPVSNTLSNLIIGASSGTTPG